MEHVTSSKRLQMYFSTLNRSPCQANHLDQTIELIKGKVEEVSLPDGIEKVLSLG